jgi:membrane protease YdiL (CAAX protease family)
MVNYDLLTEPISRRLLWSIILITIGSDLVLFLGRYSTFLYDVYEYILVVSFFVGISLHRRLKGSNTISHTFRSRLLLFAKVYIIFFVVNYALDSYSIMFLQDFHENYEQTVEEYNAYSPFSIEDNFEYEEGGSPLWEWLDFYGYTYTTDFMAGLEEVWRLGYIVLFLYFMKLLFPKMWVDGRTFVFWSLALFLSSFLFGIGHILSENQPLTVSVGSIVYYTNTGLLLGFLLLWTRNLWIMVFVHGIYNVLSSISWDLWEGVHGLFFGLMLILYITMSIMERYSTSYNPIPSPIQGEELSSGQLDEQEKN